jgi:hypothetical protein
VEKYLSSLAASHAKDLAKQVRKKVSMIAKEDTFFHTLQKESESADQEQYFLKMFKESSPAKPTKENPFSSMSSEHWKNWVTEQRQEYSQRVKWAHHTKESESSSLGWPTASLSDPEGGSQADRVEWTQTGAKLRKKDKPHMTYGAKLRDAVENYELFWATPQLMDFRSDVRKPSERSDRANKGGCKNLREEVLNPQNWATPRASATDSTRPNGKGGIPLDDQAKNWATPEAQNHTGCQTKNGHVFPRLGTQAKNYPTVTVGEEKYRISGDTQASRCLSALAVRGDLGHPDPESSNTNGKSQESLKLNPDWVEQLMGLPVGWTQIE